MWVLRQKKPLATAIDEELKDYEELHVKCTAIQEYLKETERAILSKVQQERFSSDRVAKRDFSCTVANDASNTENQQKCDVLSRGEVPEGSNTKSSTDVKRAKPFSRFHTPTRN